MISRPQAFNLLQAKVPEAHKITHALRVAEMMESIARQFGVQPEKWYLTGLLHDIDIPSIAGDWSRHGIAAQPMLQGLLPAQTLRAIATHDRNTGLAPETKLGHALVLADIVENLSHHVGMEPLRQAMRTNDFAALKGALPDDLHNLQVLEGYAQKWPKLRV